MRISDKIKAARGELSQAEFGSMVGVGQPLVSKWENGTHEPDKAQARRIGLITGKSFTYYLSDDIDGNEIPTRKIPVIGVVQAGADKDAFNEDLEPVTIHDTLSHPEELFGLVVRGNSMDQVYPEGTEVICRPMDRYDHPLENGDFVIVYRGYGEGIEATIKQYQKQDGQEWLWPRSSDPAHQQPIRVDDQITIHAIVLKAVTTTKAGRR